MTSVVRFEEWQEPTGTTVATVDGSGNIDFTGRVLVDGADMTEVTILQDTISIANSTNVTCAFNTELIDVGGWHSAGSANITLPYDGIYLITANARSVDSPNRALINVYVGGSIIASQDNNNGGFDLSCSVHAKANANDNVSMVIWQNSGGTATPLVTLGVHLVRKL